MVIFMNIINDDDIIINKYQGFITCNRLTPLQLMSVFTLYCILGQRDQPLGNPKNEQLA